SVRYRLGQLSRSGTVADLRARSFSLQPPVFRCYNRDSSSRLHLRWPPACPAFSTSERQPEMTEGVPIPARGSRLQVSSPMTQVQKTVLAVSVLLAIQLAALFYFGSRPPGPLLCDFLPCVILLFTVCLPRCAKRRLYI